MYRYMFRVPAWLLVAAISLGVYRLREQKKNPGAQRPTSISTSANSFYVTTENTKVRAGPGAALSRHCRHQSRRQGQCRRQRRRMGADRFQEGNAPALSKWHP